MYKAPKLDYLITGGLGFIGINFIQFIKNMHPDAKIGVIDMETSQANDPQNLASHKELKYFPINIRYSVGVFTTYQIDNIVHFAAESHVDRSISTPRPFIDSNILGTFEILEFTRLHQPNARFHHVSTDEVYGSTEVGAFSESSTYNPSSVYSASKAASDMLVISYIRTYGLKASISNCCNNYGRFQNEEKLIPRYIKYLKNKAAFPLYNNGLNVREWIHVDDHNKAVYDILKSNFYEKFNIGSNEEFVNIDLLKAIHSQVVSIGKDVNILFEETIDTSVSDRPGHDLRYAVDSSYLKEKIGFTPKHSVESSILDLIYCYWK